MLSFLENRKICNLVYSSLVKDFNHLEIHINRVLKMNSYYEMKEERLELTSKYRHLVRCIYAVKPDEHDRNSFVNFYSKCLWSSLLNGSINFIASIGADCDYVYKDPEKVNRRVMFENIQLIGKSIWLANTHTFVKFVVMSIRDSSENLNLFLRKKSSFYPLWFPKPSENDLNNLDSKVEKIKETMSKLVEDKHTHIKTYMEHRIDNLSVAIPRLREECSLNGKN